MAVFQPNECIGQSGMLVKEKHLVVAIWTLEAFIKALQCPEYPV